MVQQTDREASAGDGLDSVVEDQGCSYQVQTQFSTRGAPVIESMVFEGGTVDPSEADDPAVRELLTELGVAVEAARERAAETAPPESDPASAVAKPPRRWWRRFAIRIRLPF